MEICFGHQCWLDGLEMTRVAVGQDVEIIPPIAFIRFHLQNIINENKFDLIRSSTSVNYFHFAHLKSNAMKTGYSYNSA